MSAPSVLLVVLGVVLLVAGVMVAAMAKGRDSEPGRGHDEFGRGDFGGDTFTDRPRGADWAAPERDAPSGRRRGAGAGIALAVVGALLLAGGGAWALLGGDNDADDAGDSSRVAIVTSTRAPSSSSSSSSPSAATETVTTTAQAPSSGGRSSGGGRPANDLGLSTPMTVPACDGQGIVVLNSAVTPGNYASEVQSWLSEFPGSKYLRTDQACPSLRPRDDNGNVIYAVYRESGRTQEAVCRDVLSAQEGGVNAYGRWLDTHSDPNQLIAC